MEPEDAAQWRGVRSSYWWNVQYSSGWIYFNQKDVQYPQRSEALGPRKAETEGEIIDLQCVNFIIWPDLDKETDCCELLNAQIVQALVH